jgi:hypothetical protein
MSVQCIRAFSIEQVFATAPRPVVRMRYEARFDGVREHVLDRVPEVLVVADYRRGEPVAEEVALPGVSPIELLRVDAVHPLHSGGERSEFALEDDMQVRIHQAPDEDAPGVLAHLSREQRQQQTPLRVIQDDPRRRDPQNRDVIRAGRR